MDPRRWLRIEAGLKREKRENIGHQRMIGYLSNDSRDHKPSFLAASRGHS